jgi:uncharacterized protein YabN with tetrapyrrole methylase and pyrophosphatase domain
VGFDWPDGQGARDKVSEEIAELDAAVESGERAAMEHELGDTLFALVTFARKLDLDPEAALRGTLERFATRVRGVESAAAKTGKPLKELSATELDRLWIEAKRAGG